MKKEELINREEMLHYLGYGENKPDEVMSEDIAYCEGELIKAAQPAYFYKVYPIERENGRMWVGRKQLELKGESIKEHLEGCSLVALGCATLGELVDKLIEETQKKSMLDALLIDAAANAAIERVRERIEEELKQEYKDYSINWQFGIGYGDLPIETQPEFLSLVKAKEEINLVCNGNHLLIPVKSVTGFIGLKKHDQEMEGRNKEVKDGNAENEESNRKMEPTKENKKGSRCEKCSMRDRCTLKRKCH